MWARYKIFTVRQVIRPLAPSGRAVQKRAGGRVSKESGAPGAPECTRVLTRDSGASSKAKSALECAPAVLKNIRTYIARGFFGNVDPPTTCPVVSS